jgi:spore coat protein CotH
VDRAAGSDRGGGAPEPPGSPAPDAAPQVADNEELFDPERIPRFDLEIPPASLEILRGVRGPMDPAQETYVRATFRHAGETLTEVGVRIKGEASFRPPDEKSAFKIKFDEFVPKQAFRGLKRLTLNNMVEDPSFLAERMAYHLFRAAKLPAPRCNSALVYVNGTLYGLYANVETEDKPFLRRWFTSDEGNLYEEGQRDFVPGAAGAFDLETNESVDDRSDLEGLIGALATTGPATFLADVGKWLDVPHFLRFTAAEAAANQWDMYAYTVFYPNNFRIYHDPASDRLVFLPWGMDMSMKPFRDSGKPHIRLFELARQGDRRTTMVTAGLIFQRCLLSPACRSSYVAALREMIAVYEAADLEAVARRYHEQIRPHVLADPRKEYTATQFEAAYQAMLKTIRERPAAMRADLPR